MVINCYRTVFVLLYCYLSKPYHAIVTALAILAASILLKQVIKKITRWNNKNTLNGQPFNKYPSYNLAGSRFECRVELTWRELMRNSTKRAVRPRRNR